VGDSFLGRWFGSPQASDPTVEKARAELDRLAAAQPALNPIIRWLGDLLPDLAPSSVVAPVLALEPAHAVGKLANGVPLLRGEPLVVDVTSFRKRWQRACEALAAQQTDGMTMALADAVRLGRLSPEAMVAAVIEGRPETVQERAAELGLDAGLAGTVLRFTLFPLFVAIAESVEPLRAGTTWTQGHCPVCGSWPLLGEFRGLEQARFLRCGLCAAAWEAPRLWCPYCGNRDHERLRYLHAEGEEAKARALVCDACRGYVKMISTLAALPPLSMLVADVAMLPLDLAAAERAYTSPW
jgi:FdhE protein